VSADRSPTLVVRCWSVLHRARPLEEERLMCLRPFYAASLALLHPRVNLLFEFIEAASHRTWERRRFRQHEAETGRRIRE
jgi:hypothetical protein